MLYITKHTNILGGLFAGATAGNKISAQAGLGGAVNGDKAQGNGFASAQAGNQFASSGLVGDKEAALRRKEERRRRKEQKKAKRVHEKKY